MKEIFDFRRFTLLIRRIVSERGVKILGSVLFILMCMLFFLYAGYIKPSVYHQTRLMFLFFGLTLGPIMYAWVLSSEFQNNSMGISYLMLPSSTFEKWLLNTVLGISLYCLIFTASFRLFDTWFVAGLHAKYDSTGIAYLIENLEVLNLDRMYYYMPLIFGIILAFSVLIGSLHFRKNSLVYSLLSVLALFVITIVYRYFVINAILDGSITGGSLIPFYGVTLTDDSNLLKYHLTSDYTLEDIILGIGIPGICVLSVAYYFALREKEL